MRVAFFTFGCKLNQYETESLASAFLTEGCDLVDVAEAADLYIINTCTVTSKSEQKARKLIRALAQREPEALLIITGCYAQVGEELPRQLGMDGAGMNIPGQATAAQTASLVIVPQIDKPLLHDFAASLGDPLAALAFMQDKKSAFLHFYQAAKQIVLQSVEAAGSSAGPPLKHTSPFAYQAEEQLFHSRAFLKIQDGCNNQCTYCRVPLARGTAVSLEPALVHRQLQRLEAKGYREVVLTGVNITAYAYQSITFAGLLREILARGTRLRIRLSSLEPEKVSQELCEILAAPAICPHFHVPVQSGSDPMLAAMNRRYRRRQLEHVLTALQAVKPGAFLAADVIVGFPGESDADFECLAAWLADSPLAYAHVFPYSDRPGTDATRMTPKVDQATIRERARRLRSIAGTLAARFASSFIGPTRPGLTIEDGTLVLTDNFLKVHVEAGRPRNMRVRVRIDRTVPVLAGTLVSS
jgi:threonylcarbamoyladenosine tRNA methylthiotransferase MtaB